MRPNIDRDRCVSVFRYDAFRFFFFKRPTFSRPDLTRESFVFILYYNYYYFCFVFLSGRRGCGNNGRYGFCGRRAYARHIRNRAHTTSRDRVTAARSSSSPPLLSSDGLPFAVEYVVIALFSLIFMFSTVILCPPSPCPQMVADDFDFSPFFSSPVCILASSKYVPAICYECVCVIVLVNYSINLC